jgi:hypothetical protein
MQPELVVAAGESISKLNGPSTTPDPDLLAVA